MLSTDELPSSKVMHEVCLTRLAHTTVSRQLTCIAGCNLCLEQAARQTYCVNNNSSISGYDFHCLCKEPGFSEYTEGCTDFCRATEYDIEIQCSKIRECPVCNIDEVRKCERCLEDTSSTTTATTSCNLAPDADISGLFESANIEVRDSHYAYP